VRRNEAPGFDRGFGASVGRASGLLTWPEARYGRIDLLRRPASKLAKDSLIHWSVQEVRRLATRLARKRIRPEFVIAWPLWRQAHETQAKRSHFKLQL